MANTRGTKATRKNTVGKGSMREALSSSLNAEASAFKNRFERAEVLLSGRKEPTRATAAEDAGAEDNDGAHDAILAEGPADPSAGEATSARMAEGATTAEGSGSRESAPSGQSTASRHATRSSNKTSFGQDPVGAKATGAADAPSHAAPEASLQPGVRIDRVVRDSFTMPENDYMRIAATRERCLGLRLSVTKAEVLRAGLAALSRLSDAELSELFGTLEKVKTGRPREVG